MGELLKQVTCENSLNGIKLLTISHEQDEFLEDIIPSSVNSAALADILNKLPKSLLAVDGFMPTLYPVADNGIIGSRSINAMLDQLSYQPIIVNADFVSLQGYSKYEAELKLIEAGKNKHLKYTIIRPTTVYGPRDKAGIYQLILTLQKL